MFPVFAPIGTTEGPARMANQAPDLDHRTQPDGKWKFISEDFRIDPGKTLPQYQGIANTIVQLICPSTSGVIAS